MSGSDSADQWLSSYGFDLPDERIAQRPVEPRHSARLLAVDPPGEGPAPHARHLSVWDLQQQLQPGDLLVVNDTRVLRARLEARRPSGGAVELLVLEPWQGDQALPQGRGQWLCLAKPAKKLQPGDWIDLVAADQPPLPVQVLGSDPATGGRIVKGCIDHIVVSVDGVVSAFEHDIGDRGCHLLWRFAGDLHILRI